MTEDKPLPENPASQLWLKGPFAAMRAADFEQMAAFVVQSAGKALALDPAVELPKLAREELIALALRAQRAGLGEDLVGTILTFAAGRGSKVAMNALAQMLGRHFEQVSLSEGTFAERRALRRALRSIERRLTDVVLLDEFDSIRKELAGAGDAVALAETWAQFRRSGKTGATHKVLAPMLTSLKHIESGGGAFKALSGPLPYWRSPVAPAVLAKVLACEFPHLAGIADEIAAFVAGSSAASLRPIVLVGPAGIGKDAILRRAAELVGRPHGEFDLAGSSDNRILKGTARGWSTAHPSFPTGVCAQNLCANPLVQLSELDRAGGSRRNGQVHEALLSLCEPSTRRKWFDDGLGVEIDLGDVAFAFTANGTDDTPGPLLSRLRILNLERPRPEHVEAILLQCQRRFAAESQVPLENLPEPLPEAIERLKVVAGQGRFHLRLADRVARALGDGSDRAMRH